jgi:hypothetical protein
METPNTYTYRQSELPPMTDEIKAKIDQIHFDITHFILLNPGHYHALSELAETLASCSNRCETCLLSIRITPDGGEPELLPRAIGFTDLPTREKELLISTAITSTVAIKMIATLLGCNFDQAATHISNISGAQFETLSPEQMEDAVARLAESLHERPDETFFVIQT